MFHCVFVVSEALAWLLQVRTCGRFIERGLPLCSMVYTCGAFVPKNDEKLRRCRCTTAMFARVNSRFMEVMWRVEKVWKTGKTGHRGGRKKDRESPQSARRDFTQRYIDT